jgi:hypothetical protein
MENNVSVPVVSVPKKKNPLSFHQDIFEKKKESLVKYYKGEKSLLEKMMKNPDGRSLETVLAATLEELVTESDDLLSNKLILTEQNNLKEANNVTIQRTNVLGKIADISLKKQELVSRTQDVDLNSPAFFLFQQICFEKIKDTCLELDMPDEQIQIFFDKWAGKMKDWDKQLQRKISEFKANN